MLKGKLLPKYLLTFHRRSVQKLRDFTMVFRIDHATRETQFVAHAEPRTVSLSIASSIDGMIEQLNQQIDYLSQSPNEFDLAFANKIISTLDTKKQKKRERIKVVAHFKQALFVFVQQKVGNEKQVPGDTIVNALKWLKKRDRTNIAVYNGLLKTCFERQKNMPAAEELAAGTISREPPSDAEKVATNRIVKQYFNQSSDEAIWVAKMIARLDMWIKMTAEDELEALPITGQKELVEFLLYAYGNKKLYEQLKANRSAETEGILFLRDYCFLTGADRGAERLLDTLEKVQKDPIVKALSNSIYAITEPPDGCESALIEMFEETKDATDTIQTAYNEWKKAFDAVSQEKQMEWRLQDSCIDLLGKIRQEATGVDGQEEVLATVSKYLEQIGTIKERKEEVFQLLQDPAYRAPLEYNQIRRAYSHQALKEDLRTMLCIVCPGINKNQQLSHFFRECEECSDVLTALERTASLFTVHQSGDVLLRDEVEYQTLHGHKGTLYSQISLLNPKNALQFIWDFITKGPFEVSGYIGRRIHAALVATDEGGNKRIAEIEACFQAEAMTLESTTHDTVYRPDFKKLLCEKSKGQLLGKYENDEGAMLADLERRYKAASDEIVGGVMIAGNLIRNSQCKASASFVKAWARENLPEGLRLIISAFADFLFAGDRGFMERIAQLIKQIRGHEIDEEEASAATSRFCSEFIAQVLKQTIDKVNKDLADELGLDEDFESLQQVIDVPVDEIHPTLLEQKLKCNGCFKEVEEQSAFTRYIVQISDRLKTSGK